MADQTANPKDGVNNPDIKAKLGEKTVASVASSSNDHRAATPPQKEPPSPSSENKASENKDDQNQGNASLAKSSNESSSESENSSSSPAKESTPPKPSSSPSLLRRRKKIKSNIKMGRRLLISLVSFFLPGFGQFMMRRSRSGVLLAGQFLVCVFIYKFMLMTEIVGGSLTFAVFALASLWGISVALTSSVGAFFALSQPLPSRELASNDWHIFSIISLLSIVIQLISHSYEIIIINSDAMYPSARKGDFVMVRNGSYTPTRGDAVMISMETRDNKHEMRRVIGLGSEQVRVVSEQVYIGSKPLVKVFNANIQLSTAQGESQEARRFWERITFGDNPRQYQIVETDNRSPYDNTRGFFIPPKNYFLLADNRDGALDSRASTEFGFVQPQDITGKPLFVLISGDFLDFSRYGRAVQ